MDLKENHCSYNKIYNDNSISEPSTNEIFSFNFWLLINILFCKFYFIKLSDIHIVNTCS